MNASFHVVLNDQNQEKVATTLERCCASEKWVAQMMQCRPFADSEEVLSRAATIWEKLDETDYLQAFAAHPQIGDIKTLQAKYANTQAIASSEQSRVCLASQEIIEQLALANQLYLKRFGFLFIICATGKSAEEMLEALLSRIGNTKQQEIAKAATEQLKITRLRLEKLVASG
jgi:2-oxo-4-hydroxy-4-carboxy-5-ureidoimidazoline decarboxylase